MRTRLLSVVFLLALPLASQVSVAPDTDGPRTGPERHGPEPPGAERPGKDRPGVGEPGGPERLLTPEEAERFVLGRALFDRDFHKSAGLGAPEMNADSCRACHQDPVLGGAGALELNVSRFARDHAGAGPFENLPGGQTLSKLRPPWTAGREEYEPDQADVFEQRQSPSILGDGLIDGIPEAVILAGEDPGDRDGDGIRGVARRLMIDGSSEIGRFGWKAQVPHLADFVRDALGGELGMTSTDDGRCFALTSDGDASPDPEVNDLSLDYMGFFLSNLAAPRRTGSLEPQVLAGELLFERVGCARCHVPELPGANGSVPLYSDLLLHDVWPPLFRGMSEFGAGPGVYRTPPLWGIRTTPPYLHDGRASSLRAAILLHDGEARGARLAFEALPAGDRSALLAFLNDL
jgi:CxxC motif-containing protein (DUF1111 family)